MPDVKLPLPALIIRPLPLAKAGAAKYIAVPVVTAVLT